MLQKVDHFLPVSKPEISKNTVSELVEIINSGWIATGPKTKQFEENLSKFFDNRAAITVTSNTAGLYITLKMFDIGPGDYVVTTPLTFVATVNAIMLAGATPLFVDVDQDTFNIDVNKIAALNNAKIKAIIPVHYAGLPVDMDPLLDLARQRNWHVIEDAAHAMGASYKGQKIGTFGDVQVFSFHPIKNMTTGEGGCVVLDKNASDLRRFVELFRFHGIDRSIWDRFSKKGSQTYDIAMPGFKFNMSDIQSVIGNHQLAELEGMNGKRRTIIARYREAFEDVPGIAMQGVPSYEHVHSGHLFPILLKDTQARDDLAEFLREHNIGTTPYYFPVHLFSYYKGKYGYKIGDFPNAEYIGFRVLCLPLYPSLSEEEQTFVIDCILEFLK